MFIESAQEVNWGLEIAKIAVPSLIALIVPFVAGLLISQKIEAYKTDLLKTVEDYKENKERQQYRLSKLEELHNLFSEYTNSLDEYKIGIIELFESEAEFQFEKYNHLRKQLYSITKINSVLRLYARELEDDFNELIKALDNFMVEGRKLSHKEVKNRKEFDRIFNLIFNIRRKLREDLEVICDEYTGLYKQKIK